MYFSLHFLRSSGRRGMHSLSSLAFSSSSPPARKIDKRAWNEGRTEGKRRDMRMRCTKRSQEPGERPREGAEAVYYSALESLPLFLSLTLPLTRQLTYLCIAPLVLSVSFSPSFLSGLAGNTEKWRSSPLQMSCLSTSAGIPQLIR